MCEPCSSAKQAEERERQYAPMAYFQFGTALTTLRNSGVQAVKIYNVTRWTEEMFLGISRKRKHATLFGHGWVLGKFMWRLSVPLAYGEYKTVDEDWLTVLMDADRSSLPTMASIHFGLVRVQPYSDGYEALGLGSHEGLAGGIDGMELAGQAVRRLAGVSS